MKGNLSIHPTAEVSTKAQIGPGTLIWHHAQIREGAHVGTQCVIGKGVYIDFDVNIGNNVKIQNYVSIFHGVTIEDGVFIGPHVCFTNDMRPRSVNPDGTQKASHDWIISKTLIHHGAAIGANSTIVCGVDIGCWAMVGAGSVVTHDIPDYGLARGNPARLHSFVCPCGENLTGIKKSTEFVYTLCVKCGKKTRISLNDWREII